MRSFTSDHSNGGGGSSGGMVLLFSLCWMVDGVEYIPNSDNDDDDTPE